MAIGSAIPFAAVYGTAAQIRGIGKGIGQGIASVIASPTLLLGLPLVGLLLDAASNFSLAFGRIVVLASTALVASWLGGAAIERSFPDYHLI